MTGTLEWIGEWWSRITAGIALAAVASATGVISYSHIYALTLAEYQSPLVAHLMPVGIDGLILVGSVVLLQASPYHPYLGWLGVAPGVAASLFANAESGIRHGWLAATWATVPAASFALATFLLERWLKSQVGRGGSGGSDGLGETSEFPRFEGAAGQCPHGVATTAEQAVTTAYLHGRDCLGEAPSQRHLSTSFGIPRPRVAELVSSLNGNASQSTGGTP